MLKRHVEQIWERLDQLYANGITHISWGEIYHWYNIERINKKPWRDLQERWQELLDEKKEEYQDPLIAESAGGVSLFFSRKPGKLSERL